MVACHGKNPYTQFFILFSLVATIHNTLVFSLFVQNDWQLYSTAAAMQDIKSSDGNPFKKSPLRLNILTPAC